MKQEMHRYKFFLPIGISLLYLIIKLIAQPGYAWETYSDYCRYQHQNQ